MDSRERITALLNIEEADRVGFVDGPWRETVERWEKEGLPQGIFINECFGMDIYGIGVDTSAKYDSITYEEGDTWRLVRDSSGVKQRVWRNRSGVPLPVEAAVSSLDEFKERIEPMLDPDFPIRISSPRYPFRADIEKVVQRFQKRFFVTANVVGPYEYARHICGGHRGVLKAMMADRPFAAHMYSAVGRFLSCIAKGLLDAGVDGLWVFDDIGFANGPFFSPKIYQRYLQPAHQRICAPFLRRGLPVILHTDGNVEAIIPDIIRSGFTALQPLEAKAGMDAVKLKHIYGDKLALMGNIDARTLSSNDAGRIAAEVRSKIEVAAQGGGYIMSSDHSVPPSVSLETFKHFSNLPKKIGRYC